MKEPTLIKSIPVGALIVFIGSFFIFLYLLKLDNDCEDSKERNVEETIWIGIFFTMLLSCIVISALCIINSQKEKKGTLTYKINKNVNLLREKFNDLIPRFEGKKLI